MTGDEHQEQLHLGRSAGLAASKADAVAGAETADGLSWTWDLDIETLLAAVTGPAPWSRDPVTAAGQAVPAVGTPQAAPDPAGHAASSPVHPDAAPSLAPELVPARQLPRPARHPRPDPTPVPGWIRSRRTGPSTWRRWRRAGHR